ncbi:MAG: hypothetical protein HY814_08260 [Candidatus Riflebacteria bacterium]|nr:hypothetical protein [Candidatus Riflebacteria bacterium]
MLDNLDACLAGELEPASLAEAGRHLEACSDCRTSLARARRLASLLAEAGTPPLPERFAERVLARVMERRRQSAQVWSIRAWWRTLASPLRAAAVAMVLVGAAIGGGLGWSMSPVPPASTSFPAQQAADLFAGYGLDAMGDAPDGSLPRIYLALLDGRTGEDR